MKYLEIVLFFLVLMIGPIDGQSLKFELQPSFGFYSMSNLNRINDAVSLNLPFDTKVVSDFPPYWYFRPVFSLQFEKFSVGLNFSFQTTGSKLSAKDYSGEYSFNMKVKSISPGINGEVILINFKNINLSFYSALGISYSRLGMSEFLMILDQKITDESISYKAKSYFLEPGFNLSYPVSFLNIGLYSGYLFGFGQQAYYTNNDKENKLYIPGSKESITPDWNGLRFGITVCYKLKTRNN